MTIDSAFWSERLERNRSLSLPDQWERYEEAGTVENFRIAASGGRRGRRGFFYTDSDLHKWADAVSRVLAAGPDPVLEELLDRYADLMERAICEDGYLYTWNQIYFPGIRWKNLRVEHELYCMGHFIEAAVSHHRATGSRRLLGPAVRTADLIVAEFAGDGRRRFPGHQEIEIALVRLARETGNGAYRDLAAAFLAARGSKAFPGARLLAEFLSHLFRACRVRKLEGGGSGEAMGFDVGENLGDDEPPLLGLRSLGAYLGGSYLQEHRPFERQTAARGHSVRWAYGQIAAAMLAADKGVPPADLAAMEARWLDLAARKTYITGGIGSLPVIEGFGRPYELDNRYAYCETCAAIGSAWWNRELSNLTGLARYADMVERLLYNGASVGLSLDGRSYSYRNPLESAGGMARREWFATACCPSNLSRFWAGLTEAAFAGGGNGLRLEQYLGCRGTLAGPAADVEMESSFPWEGRARLLIAPESDTVLRFRIPGWAGEWSVSVDGHEAMRGAGPSPSAYQDEFLAASYEELSLSGGRRTEVEFQFPMAVRAVSSRPEVKANRGRTALCRGPLVYCLEGPGSEDPAPEPSVLEFLPDRDLPGGKVGVLSGGGRTFVPYFAWGNRERMPMKVWLEKAR